MVSLARLEPSCSVYGRECVLEFFRQRVGNDTDLGDLCRAGRPAGADSEARDRKPHHNEPMLADDLDHCSPRAHHRAGADQDFADNTIDHRSKLGIVIERGQLLQGAVGFL